MPTQGSPLYQSPLKTRDGRILPTRGEEICDWIEANLVFGEGDRSGEPVRLREFQRRFLYRLYEYYPETGRRRYKRALWMMGKGNGKTPVAAFVGAVELNQPARRAPHVLIGASSLKQANLVFGDLAASMRAPSPLAPHVETFELEVRLKGRPGLAERVAAEAGTNDGARATTFLADELHEWVGRLERVFLILEGAVAKREDGFTLSTSTAGTNKGSEVKRQFDAGCRLASGETSDDTFLFECFAAPDGLDLGDPAVRLAAVLAANPAAGDFNSIENIMHRYDTMPLFEWQRYYLNQFTKAGAQWIGADEWAVRSSSRKLEDGETIWAAFDGSYARDSTGIVACTADGFEEVIGVWERPSDAAEDWVVPREEVDHTVAEMFKRYRVRELACDPPGWHEEIANWAELYGDEVVIHYQTSTPSRMIAACSKFYSAVLEGGISHSGDPVLARHLSNAVVKEIYDGYYITKEHSKSANKIDIAIAAVIAYDRATLISKPVAEPRIRSL